MHKGETTNWDILAALRFVLALIVAGGHIVWLNRDTLSTALESLPKCAVVGFLLVSGYSIAASLDRGESGFYFRRFKRVYPIYLFAIATAIGLEIWLGRYSLPNYTIEPTGSIAAIGNLFLVQTFLVKPVAYNGVVWSLAVESSYYIAAPFLRRQSIIRLLILIAVSAGFIVLPRNYEGGTWYVYLLKMNAIKYFWPFAMGLILYSYRSSAIAVGFLLLGAALVKMSEDLSAGSWLVVLTFVLTFGVIMFARDGYGPRSKLLEYLGDISYPLYLVQIPMYVLAYRIFGLTNSAALLALAIAMACIVFEVIDRRVKKIVFDSFSKASLTKSH